jgi:uncharacterized protein YaiE (UPF0345 family)
MSVSANSTKTLMQLAGATNQCAALLRVKVAFEGVTATDKPVLVEIVTQTTAGTMSAGTENIVNSPTSVTVQTVAQYNATAEPTLGVVLDSVYVHLQSGYEWVFQRGQDEIMVPAGGRIGIRVTNPTGNQATNASCTVYWEE